MDRRMPTRCSGWRMRFSLEWLNDSGTALGYASQVDTTRPRLRFYQSRLWRWSGSSTT